jgi:protein SCO1/2
MLDRLSISQSNNGLRYVIFLAAFVVLFAVGLFIGNNVNSLFGNEAKPSSTTESGSPGAAIVNPPHQVSDFTLTDQNGHELSLSDLRGKAVVLFFGYTHCPDVCPTTLADFGRVKQALGETAEDVRFVFISIDGARDTPQVMKSFLDQFDSDFIGLTGDETLLAQIGSEYGLMVSKDAVNVEHEHEDDHEHDDAELNVENYFVQHTSPSFLIDRDGYLRLVYFYGTKPGTMVEGIQSLLQ